MTSKWPSLCDLDLFQQLTQFSLYSFFSKSFCGGVFFFWLPARIELSVGYCFIGVGVGLGFYSGDGYNKQVFLLVKLDLKFLRLRLWCYTEYFGPAW